MTVTSNNEKAIRRYLLGELTEAEQIQLEQQYFSDADIFEQFLVIEDQLIDDYIRGQLGRRDCDRFEKHFLASAKRRERVELARSLIKTVSRPSAARAQGSSAPLPLWQSLLAAARLMSPALRLSFAVVALVLISGLTWLALEHVRLRNQLEQLKAEQAAQQQREDELRRLAENVSSGGQSNDTNQPDRNANQNQAEPLSRQPSPRAVFSFELSPLLQRSGAGMGRVVIPESVHTLQLKLSFDAGGEYKNYRVAIRTAEGSEILARTNLRARSSHSGELIILSLPARSFPRGEYVLSLTGVTASGSVESIEDYSFGVTRK